MADKRELILVRIMAICTAEQTGAGIETVVRNRAALDNDKRPACVLLDGDERAAFPARPSGRSMPLGPTIMLMTPELYVILKEERPVNALVGEMLNLMRIKLSKAIATDAQLKTLLGGNGGIIYNGSVTDLKSGSALTGQMKLDFSYRYVFDPSTA